jgi:murein tripeptide amidase MpaA
VSHHVPGIPALIIFDSFMPITISDRFDGGAIEILRADDPAAIELAIRRDSHADVLQWFHFRLQGARGQSCTMRLTNAAQAAFPDGWRDYQAVASYDLEHWFRVPTTYDGQALTVTHTPRHNSVYYAYFEPYSSERHRRLMARTACTSGARTEALGRTVEGRDLDLAIIGDLAAQRKVWVIARQHPGETMAEWCAEGLIEALLDCANPFARRLLRQAVFYIVPNMNPDGAARGNLRTNAAGVNLNREWSAPSLERSPEVYAVKQRIHETGCDLFLDLHGDESLPYVFVAGCEMLEDFSEKQAREQQAFIDSLQCASPDFQTRHGYEAGKYREEMLQLASKYIGHTFKCVSLTLEMPFKDNAELPDAEVGWSGARSARLGAALLQPILRTLDGAG